MAVRNINHPSSLVRARLAREYFIEASRPFYQQMARIHSIYDQPRMMVAKDGSVAVLPSTLPDFAQRWIEQLEQGVEQCRRLAGQQEMWP